MRLAHRRRLLLPLHAQEGRSCRGGSCPPRPRPKRKPKAPAEAPPAVGQGEQPAGAEQVPEVQGLARPFQSSCPSSSRCQGENRQYQSSRPSSSRCLGGRSRWTLMPSCLQRRCVSAWRAPLPEGQGRPPQPLEWAAQNGTATIHPSQRMHCCWPRQGSQIPRLWTQASARGLATSPPPHQSTSGWRGAGWGCAPSEEQAKVMPPLDHHEKLLRVCRPQE
mmetsp:Transcript_58444/g.167769  ORF Transcript_58444/g.167769 Transcript_58444/m.167769 type:complete len:220 (-) Transcript_58444:535-1194(-)